MRDIDRAQRLLGLFTSADCAEAIAGDLIEERRSRGAFWFWRHVLGTVLAVSKSAVTDAPWQSLNLVAAGCALFATPAFAGVAAVSLFPQLIGTLVSWIVLSLFWWGGGLWTGASLVTIAQTRGMAACVVLALVGEALLIGFGLTGAWQHAVSARTVAFYTIALVAPAPLLAGGAIARSWAITCASHRPEQKR
jgi:hypothetical protein